MQARNGRILDGDLPSFQVQRFRCRSRPLQQTAIPSRRFRGTTGQGNGPPDKGQGAPAVRAGLGSLSILDAIAAGAVRVEQTTQTAEINRLSGSIEDVRGASRRDGYAQRLPSAVEVHDADRQAAVQRHRVASIYR